MKLRSALLIAAVLPLGAGAASAHAAAPSCNIVKDDSGDATYNNVPGEGNDDIVSGDLASDGKTITAVIRLAELVANDPQAPLGHGYFMTWGAKGSDAELFLSARTYPQGTKFIYGYQGVDPNSGINTSYTLGETTGTIDTAKKEVRISAPTAAWKDTGAKMAKGNKLLAPTVQTYRIAGQGFAPSQNVGPVRVPIGGLLLPFDDATGKNYVVGTNSCVAVGK